MKTEPIVFSKILGISNYGSKVEKMRYSSVFLTKKLINPYPYREDMITSVSQKTNHESSEQLSSLHPYFPEAHAAFFAGNVDPYQVERAFGNRAVPKLAKLLEFSELPHESRCTALRVMVALTGEQNKKQEAIREGAVASCTDICARGVEDATSSPTDVREQATLVLASLASAPQSQPRFDKSSTIAALTGTLQAKESKVREAAALALLNYSTSRAGADMIVACSQMENVQTIKFMVQALIEPSALVSLYLVSALGNICRYAEGTELALNAGIVAKLVEMLDAAPTSDMEIPLGSPIPGTPAGTRLQTLNTMWNTGNHLRGKEDLIEQNAVSVITAALDDCSADVRRCASGALMALSVDEGGKSAIMEQSLEQLPPLLLDEDNAVRKNARIAIVHSSENRSARFMFVQQLIKTWTGTVEQSSELVLRVFGKTAAESLCLLLQPSESNADELERATVTLRDMLTQLGDVGNDAVMSTLYITERLADRLKDERESTRVAAAEILKKLCARHKYAVKRLKALNLSEAPSELAEYI